MKLWTYEEIEDRVRKAQDLEDEDNFIDEDEMAGYCNEAIDDIESEIIKIHEDYLLTKTSITLVNGTQSYALPTNIFAQKIRQVLYKNGERIYPIMRIRDPHKFYQREEIDYFGTGEMEYLYMLQSEEGAQDKIYFSPVPAENGAYVQMWYIRNAKRIPMVGESVNGSPATRSSQLATVLDIPEGAEYIIAYMKMMCIDKERDPERFGRAVAIAKDKRESLVATLTDRTPDNQNEIPPDMSFYMEMN